MPIPLPSDSPRRPAPCPEPTARHSPSKTKTIRIPSAAPHFQDQHRRLTAASPQAPGSIGPFTSSKQPFPAADIKYSIHAHSPLVVPTNSTGGPTPFPEPAPPPDSRLTPSAGKHQPIHIQQTTLPDSQHQIFNPRLFLSHRTRKFHRRPNSVPKTSTALISTESRHNRSNSINRAPFPGPAPPSDSRLTPAPKNIGPFTSSKHPFPAANIKFSIHPNSSLIVPANSTGVPTPFPKPPPP